MNGNQIIYALPMASNLIRGNIRVDTSFVVIDENLFVTFYEMQLGHPMKKRQQTLVHFQVVSGGKLRQMALQHI